VAQRLSIGLIIVIVGGALVAGCGSSASNSKSSSQSSSSGGATGAGATQSPTVLRAIAACKQDARRQPALSASAKARLEGICAKAVNGGPKAVREAIRDVCVATVEASPAPAGETKQHALAACRA
jgi:hypothetical protein